MINQQHEFTDSLQGGVGKLFMVGERREATSRADDDAAIGIGDGRKRLSRPRWARGCFW